MKKIRQGDTVVVTTGKYKGKTGDVLRVFPNDKVLVEGINMVKKNVRPNPQQNQTGGIIDREAPLHISNVALYDGKKASRVGIKVLQDGTKKRFFKTTGDMVEGR